MSKVTHAILSFSTMESWGTRPQEVINRVNKFFTDGQKFVVPEDDDWYGGSKHLERPTFFAAFNYLDLKNFVSHLENIVWKYPTQVQLLVCGQDDDFYQPVVPVKVNDGSTDYENSIRLDELQRMKDSWITWGGDFHLPTAVEDRVREIRQDWKNCQEAVPPYYDCLTEGTSETCHRPMPCSVHGKNEGE